MTRFNIKKVAALALVCVTGAVAVTGCGSKDKNDISSEYNVDDYVKLGTYTGLSADEKVVEVTDSDVQSAIDSLVEQKATYNDVTDRAVKSEDQLTIDYTKKQEGQEDVTKTDASVTIGSSEFGDEFDNNVIGMTANESKTFTIKQQSSDSTEETTAAEETTTAEGETETKDATVDVTYTVTVKTIKEKVLPEFNDEFVASNTDYKTVDEYKAGKRTELEENNQTTAENAAKTELLNQVVKNSTVSGVPAFLYNLNYNTICQSYSTYAGYFGMTLSDYVSAAGSSMDELKSQAMETTIQTIVIESLLKTLGQDISDEEYETKLNELVKEYGWDSVDAIEEEYSKDELMINIRSEKALNYLYDNSTINKSTVASDAQ